MIRRLFAPLLACWIAAAVVSAQPRDYEPTDPIAAIDGQPIFLGELNLALGEQLGIEQPRRARLDVQRAAAVILVRRHLALRALREKGGDALETLIERRTDRLTDKLQRRGITLQDYAERRASDVGSLRAHWTWQIAWQTYLDSRLTEANLERFFQKHPLRYAGGRWEISQIFFEIDDSVPDAAAIAEHRMDRLVETLSASDQLEADFAAAARRQSESGSSANGGRVGWVEKAGDIPAEVLRAVRATPPGEVSEPVRSPLGLHLVLVHRRETQVKSFEDLVDRARLRRDAADALFRSLVRRQRAAKVVWFIESLEPPASVAVVPGKRGSPTEAGQNRRERKKRASEALGQNTSDAEG